MRVRVSPGSHRAEIAGRHGDAWKIRVPAPAEGGKANHAVVGLLAETLALPRSSIALVYGHAARDKLVELSGVSPTETERRLAAVGKDGSE